MKKFLKGCLAAALSLSSLVTSSLTTPVFAEEEPVEISLMIPDWGVPTDDMLKDFQEKTNIKVNVIPTAWDDIRDKVATASVGKKAAADVIEVDWSWTGEFVSANWLAPIEIDEDTLKDMPNLETFKVEDQYYAVPYANDFRIAYSNQEMFKKAGIEELPTNWNQLIEDAKKIKEAGVVDYPISIPLLAEENSTTTFLWLAYTRNGIVFNDDNTLNHDALVDTLTLIDSLVKDELVNPANTTLSGMEAYGQIATADTANMTGPSSFVTRIEDESESKVVGQVQPSRPLSKDGDYADKTVPFNEAIGISAYTEHPEEALEFVKWYTSPEIQEQLNAEISATPTRLSVLEKLFEAGQIQHGDVFYDVAGIVENPFPNGVPDYYAEMSSEIFNGINQLATGQLTVEQAVEQIESAVNALAQK
ncbi:MAG: ABC transporter substrate-binding protein [Facklamia hominis]